MKLKCVISFRGTAYCGWQVQKNGKSVQQTLQDASEKLFGFRPDVTGCSRTDSGVHAKYYVCTFSPAEGMTVPAEKVPTALNVFLPDDISVLSCERADDSFHPRYSAKGKEYTYLILNRPERDPFLSGLALHYKRPLNVEKMRECALPILGKHDFTSFMAKGSDIEDAVRTVSSLAVRKEGDLVSIKIAADGFLYNMVRIIVGTLIEASEGRFDRKDVERIIASRDRTLAGHTAKEYGLYLTGVYY